MTERDKFPSQQKLPIINFTQANRFQTEGVNVNITVQSGDAQFVSFRSLNELNPKFGFNTNSIDSSSQQLNQTIQNDLTKNKKMILMLRKTLYKQDNEYQGYQENIIKQINTVTRIQKQVKKVPHRIDPFNNFNDKSPNTIQQIAKKKVSYPMYFNGAFFSKLQHSWIQIQNYLFIYTYNSRKYNGSRFLKQNIYVWWNRK